MREGVPWGGTFQCNSHSVDLPTSSLPASPAPAVSPLHASALLRLLLWDLALAPAQLLGSFLAS